MPRVIHLSDSPPTYLIGGETPEISYNTPSPSPSTMSSLMVVVIVVASAIIVSASLYLLLRFFSKHCNRRILSDDVVTDSLHNRDVASRLDPCLKKPSDDLISSLPIFTFGSINGGVIAAGDCAVCLSKFERNDQLRLLPLCCHAFHAECIDAWLSANLTCPLCRSTVHPTEEDVLNKILGREGNDNNNNSNSFRIQIGSISRRRGPSEDFGNGQRSYSIGSFEYIVDDGYEVAVESAHRRSISVDKDSTGLPVPSAPEAPGENLAGEVSGRSWLRDYVDRLASVSSRTLSLRSSGRFFAGSSRRSDIVVTDLESNRAGEEISELFRWLSGV